MSKAMTLRLPDDKAAELEAVARADEMPVSEAVRTAIDRHIEERRGDEEFKARLKALMEQNERVLQRLAE